MPHTIEQAKSTIPYVTDERVSITRRDNHNTEKCDATLTWIGAFVPESRHLKAPRTLPEAESVLLLSSPNTVLKIYHSYISCPELTSETNTTKKARNSWHKNNPMMFWSNTFNVIQRHQHLNIRSHKNTVNISYKQQKTGLIEWAGRLGFSFIFILLQSNSGRKEKKKRWFRNRRGEETSHLTGSFHTLGSVFELCQQILERKTNHWSFSTGSEDENKLKKCEVKLHDTTKTHEGFPLWRTADASSRFCLNVIDISIELRRKYVWRKLPEAAPRCRWS